MNKDLLTSYYDAGYELACKFRDEGISQHPEAIATRDWFKQRMWESAYSFWETWDFERTDVSDKLYKSLSETQRDTFVKREKQRLRYGVWKKDPNWETLSEERKAEIKAKFPWAPWINLLSPYHYFLLNYCRLKTNDGGVVEPYYYRRDALFWEVHDALENRTLTGSGLKSRGSLVVFKTRGSRFSSTLVAKGLRNLIVMANRGYQMGMAINTKEKIHQYATKVVETFNTLPEWVQPLNPKLQERIKPKMSQGAENARVEVSFWDYENDKLAPFANRLVVKGHKPGFWEDLRLAAFCADEAGICEYPIGDLIDKASACMRNDRMEQVGLAVIGGTSDAQNELNNPYLRELQKNPKRYNAFIFFAGAQHIAAVTKHGWTDEDAVKEEVSNVAEQYRLSGDIASYIRYKSLNPITVEDTLYVQGSTHIDVERVNKHLRSIQPRVNSPDAEEPISIRRGIFTEALSEGMKFKPKFVPKVDGGWYIMEQPPDYNKRERPDVHYIMGVDNVDLEISEDRAEAVNNGIGKMSRTSAVIMNVTENYPVAYYLYRHGDPREDYLQILLACLHYNCYALIERNKPKNIDFFKHYSFASYPAGYFMRWCYPTPLVYGGNWNRVRRGDLVHYGLHTGPHKRMWYENFIVPYMHESTEKILMPGILETIAKWSIEDKRQPDLGMAFMIALMAREDMLSSGIVSSRSRSSAETIMTAYKAISNSSNFTSKWGGGAYQKGNILPGGSGFRGSR